MRFIGYDAFAQFVTFIKDIFRIKTSGTNADSLILVWCDTCIVYGCAKSSDSIWRSSTYGCILALSISFHSQHKLIPLTLIYGHLRSCIPMVIKRHTSHARATTMDDDMDSATDDDDEDLMQDHEPFTMEISPNILQSILLYFDDDKFNETFGGKQCGSFVWKMSTLQLLTAQSMESIPFQIGSFVWHLSVYPYGIDTEHLNFTNLYINLSSSNSTLFGRYFLFELVVNARLYCIETSSCWSSIKTFKCDSDKHGWQKGALLIHELCQYKELTFVVYINILRIRGYDKRIWYQYPLQLPAVNECNKFVLEWKIDTSLL
eukprot:924618_1